MNAYLSSMFGSLWLRAGTSALGLAAMVMMGGCGIGDGIPFDAPIGVTVLPDQKLVVTDPGQSAVFRVDPDSGDRTVVSSRVVGDGPELESPIGVLAESAASVLVVDSEAAQILRVDLVSGDRSVVADGAKGSGPVLVEPYGIVALENGDLVVSDTGGDAIVRVDSISGDRTLISGNGAGDGPGLDAPRGLLYEGDGNVLVANSGSGNVLRVAMDSGDRSVVASSARGQGADLTRPYDLTMGMSGVLHVSDNALGEVLAIDIETGNRNYVAQTGDKTLARPAGIAAEEHGGIVVVDTDLQAVVRLEPVSSEALVVSDANIYSGRGGASGVGGVPGGGRPDSEGGGGGSGGPPDGGGDEGFGNNLSTPVVFAEGMGVGGSPVTNADMTPNYPNTGLRPTAADNVTVTGLPFMNLVEPLVCVDTDGDGVDDLCAYPQRSESVWQAEWLDGAANPVPVTVDWSDNLTKQTWTSRSVVRVETVLTDLIDSTTAEPATPPDLTGFNMYFLYGEGQEETQGTDGTTALINEKVYSVAARLQIDKLTGTDPDGDHGVPVTDEPLFDSAVYESFGTDGPGGYTAEVNVAGSVIYGYNWKLRQFVMPAGVSKEGWWRLTFSIDPVATYSLSDDHEKQEVSVPGNAVLTTIHPLDTAAYYEEPVVTKDEDGDTGSPPLYEPILDTENNLTVLEVFITERREGGRPTGGGGPPQ